LIDGGERALFAAATTDCKEEFSPMRTVPTIPGSSANTDDDDATMETGVGGATATEVGAATGAVGDGMTLGIGAGGVVVAEEEEAAEA
jgi:hypothetical protein